MIPTELTLHVQPDIPLAQIEHQIQADGTVLIADLSAQQWQTYFERWLAHLSPQTFRNRSCELSLVLTTDADIQSLNTTYRQQPTPTDVLAFAALEGDMPSVPEWETLPVPLGDIVISVETAARQATQLGHSFNVELVWLGCHGLLHLLGWDHPDLAQLTQMLTQQAELLFLIGLEPPVWTVQEFGYLY
jgi:probable rRNA maturation factor